MGLFSKKDKKAAPPAAAAPAAPPANVDFSNFKVKVKCAKNRMQLQKNKYQNNVDKSEREVAILLSEHRENIAQTKTEQAIRDLLMIESFEVLNAHCDLLLSRANMFNGNQEPIEYVLESNFHILEDVIKIFKRLKIAEAFIFFRNSYNSNMPLELREAICTVVYSSPRVQIEEFEDITKMLKQKYGTAAIEEIQRLQGAFAPNVNPQMIRKLAVSIPEGYLVLNRMEDIAKRYDVVWNPPPEYEMLRSKSVLDHRHNQQQQSVTPFSTMDIPGGARAMGVPAPQAPMQQGQADYQGNYGGGIPGMYAPPGPAAPSAPSAPMYDYNAGIPGGAPSAPTGGNLYPAPSDPYSNNFPPSERYGQPGSYNPGATDQNSGPYNPNSFDDLQARLRNL